MPDTAGPADRPRLRSLALRVGVMLVIFLIVPVALYLRFQAADKERSALLQEVVERQGKLIAAAIAPTINSNGMSEILAVSSALKDMGERAGANVKLLLSPASDPGGGFFFVAAWPPVDASLLDRERTALIETGILLSVRKTCAGGVGETLQYTNARGAQELIASVDALENRDGCWVVVTSYEGADILRSGLGRSFWEAPEVLIAAIVYVLLAAVAVWLSTDIWISLKRFQRLAAGHEAARRAGLTFQSANRFKELEGIAADFDRMVAVLQKSSESIRRSAEENAHAFKAPIAVMRQALDPLQRTLSDFTDKEQRSVEIIEASIDKLDALVGAARALEHATADSLANRVHPVRLMPLLQALAEDYSAAGETRDVGVKVSGADGLTVLADTDLLETALENLIENAVSFSPDGSTVRVVISGQGAICRIVISDNGPGVAPEDLERVFDRYVSKRPASASRKGGESHFGIGLFMVRRNVELMRGKVYLENRQGGGLDAIVELPTFS